MPQYVCLQGVTKAVRTDRHASGNGNRFRPGRYSGSTLPPPHVAVISEAPAPAPREHTEVDPQAVQNRSEHDQELQRNGLASGSHPPPCTSAGTRHHRLLKLLAPWESKPVPRQEPPEITGAARARRRKSPNHRWQTFFPSGVKVPISGLPRAPPGQ